MLKKHLSGDEIKAFSANSLPINIKIDKYTIVDYMAFDDESTAYLCVKGKSESKYILKEFFPRSISKRNKETNEIFPLKGMEVKFKTLAEDFQNLHETLSKLKNNSSLPEVIEIINKNNTLYIVFKDEKLVSIDEKIKENGNKFTWNKIKQVYMEFLNNLSELHSVGIIHRGISDENVYFNESGNLVLRNFATVSNRTSNSEINAELFENYSAPEQYNPSQWQGTWTDVYSSACLLYKLLSDEEPIKNENGEIPTLEELNINIAENISDAVSAAMLENVTFRVHSVDEFSGLLLEDTSSNTMVFSAVQPQNNAKDIKTTQKIIKNSSGSNGTTVILLHENNIEKPLKKTNKNVFGYFCVLVFAVFFLFMSSDEKVVIPINPPEEYEQVTFNGFEIIDFSGKKVDEVINDQEYLKNYNFIIIEEYNESYKKGEIFSQSPRSKIKAVNKVNMILKVSKGNRTVIMPNIIGKEISEAKEILYNYGINYQIIDIIDNKQESGKVTSTSFEPGTTIDKFENKVYIFVAKNVISNQSSSSSSSDSSSSSKKDKDED